jgi:two-component system, OmpR family, response regulator MprA
MTQGYNGGRAMPQLLAIDDELSILDVIRIGMQKEGFTVEIAQDGLTGMARARTLQPDIIVLDILLPGINGLEVCRQLRADSVTANIPILMLTAKDEIRDRVVGLEMGADDYLTKPFSFDELLARVRAILRRQQRINNQAIGSVKVLQFADLVLDEASREVTRGERRIELTATEYNLLHLLMSYPRQVLDRMTILDRVWGYDFMGETNIIEVYIRYLREKIEDDPSAPRLIQTVRGVGYVLRGA